MKIIDAHIHFSEGEGFDRIAVAAGHRNSEAHLRKAFGENGVVHAVVMGNRGLDPALHEYPDFLSYCVGLDSHSFDPAKNREALEQVEQHLRRKNCVGLKLYPGYNPQTVNDPLYEPFYELCRDYGKPVAVHTGATSMPQAGLKYSHPLTLDEAAAKHPDIQFVMCHLGNPWIVDAAAVLSKNKNVAADLSGMLEGSPDMLNLFAESAGYIEHIRTWLGYVGDWDRLLYGTDWPLVHIPSYIQFVSRLVPEPVLDKVFFHNANRIYRLGLD